MARQFVGAQEAEAAHYRLGFIGKRWQLTCDQLRRRRVIPMILREIRRREQLLNSQLGPFINKSAQSHSGNQPQEEDIHVLRMTAP